MEAVLTCAAVVEMVAVTVEVVAVPAKFHARSTCYLSVKLLLCTDRWAFHVQCGSYIALIVLRLTVRNLIFSYPIMANF